MMFAIHGMPRSMSRSISRMARAGLALGLLIGLTACGQDDMQDLEAWIEKQRNLPGVHPKPIKEPSPYIAFSYPGHDRDPFDSRVIKARVAEASDEEDDQPVQGKDLIDWDRALEYLESFPLDSLRMVGTLAQEGTRWALIQTPDDTIQRVKKDNYLGLNRGRIVTITQTNIGILEVVPDGFGGWKQRENEIALSD